MTPDGWVDLPLSDLATIVSGGTPSRREPTYWDGDVSWATPTDVTNLSGRVISETTSTITHRGLANSSASLLPPRSLLMTTRATIGACAINSAPMATNQGFQNLVPKESACVDFLYYLIQHHRRRLERLAAGSTFLEASKRTIHAFRVAVPNVSEQRKIAAILASVDDSIEKTQAVIDQVQIVKRGLMQELLTRGLPGRHTRFKQTKIGEVPDAWVYTMLGSVLELKRGYDLPKRDRTVGTVPVISSSGETDTHGEARVKGPGVVTGRYGNIGQVFFVADDFWPLNTTLYVRDFKGNDPRFISHFLRGIDFSPHAGKTAVPGVNRNHLHRTTVVLPPDINEQRTIAAILSSVDDSIEKARLLMDSTRVLMSALMSDLLTGKLRVTPDV